MRSKERVLRAIKRQETDRIPVGIFGTSQAYQQRLCTHLGVASWEEMYRRLGIDVWDIWQTLQYRGPQRLCRGEPADFWGIPVSAGKDGDSSEHCPLRDVTSVDEVEAYPWPSVDDFDGSDCERILDEHAEFAVIGGVWAPIFHNVTWLCGFETTLMNLVAQPEVSEAIIRHVTDFWVAYTRKTLELARGKIDIVGNCNDFGGQCSMLLSPDLFHRFFRPALQRLYDVIHEFDVYILQHSCGAVAPIIHEFVEMGADILNPVQVSATGMDVADLKSKFGHRLTFFGGIDTQHVLPEGPASIVRETTRRTISILGKDGGYILAPSQGLEADIPIEHFLAMLDEGHIASQR